MFFFILLRSNNPADLYLESYQNATPDLEAFQSLLGSVPVLRAAWLSQPEHASGTNPGRLLVPTHIKQLRTTVPVDMKAAKEQRAKGKAEAKLRKKERKASGSK